MAANEIERRTVQTTEVRVDEKDGKRVLSGYGAVFYRADDPGTEFEIVEGVKERVAPGAFERAIREDDVRGLFNHAQSLVLGRTKSGTLSLREDEKGLRYEIDLPDTQVAKDLAVSVARGDISGSSFAFVVQREAFTRAGDTVIREIQAVRLLDVGPVTFPAYKATSADVRDEVLARALAAERWRAESDARARALELRRRRP